jgi:hypothetical protein
MALQAYSAGRQATDLSVVMDYLDKPQYLKKFIETYPDQYDLGLMQVLGLMEEAVGGETYYWQENDKFISIPVVGSIVDNTGTISITYGVGSYTDNGKKSYGRVGETIELPNYLSGLITAKNTSVDNAHVITVKPIGTDLSTGNAITSAQLAAGITAGMPIPVETNGFTEGSFGQDKSVISTVSRYQNTLQNITDTYTVTFNAMGQETWVDFNFMAPDGTAKNRYYVKEVFETEKRMMRAIMLAAFNGKGGSTTDASGNTVNFTTGLYTTAEKYSTLLPIGDTIGKAYYDQLEKILRNTFAGNDFTQYVGLEANQKLQDFKVDYKKNRPDLVGGETIDTRITTVQIGDNNYDIVQLKVLSDPFTLGTVGKKYSTSILTVPKGKTRVQMEGRAMDTNYFVMRYKPRVRPYKGKSYFSVETLGYNGQIATSAEDVKTYAFKATIGGETHSARNFVLSYKA